MASEDCENVVIYYNEFKSAIASLIRKLELLPRKQFLAQFKYVTKHDTSEPEKDFAKHFSLNYIQQDSYIMLCYIMLQVNKVLE